VTLLITTEAIEMPASQAIPMLQLTHEAVTNAYKHAFPDNAHGTVAVHLSRAASDGIILRIMDNGIGLPAIESAGNLGWTLMRGLAAQLNAALTIARPSDVPGTVVTARVYRATKAELE